jgi:diguanylate cyclase (GGDEF)-like protein/PAS domain S-box-containing protein
MYKTTQPYMYESPDFSARSQSILIVDDEQRMRSSLKLLLDDPKRELLECATGTDAITTLKTRNIDLVLLDINLPDISGLEVMEWISRNKIATIVIFISADTSIDSAILALRNGAVEFIRKPSELGDVQFKVKNALHRHRLEYSNSLMTARLEQSERLHRFLVENSPDLIYTLDHTGHFVFINKRVETLLGYTQTELIGKPYNTIVHDDDIGKALYAFTERRRDDRATFNLEIRLKYKDKSHQDVTALNIVAIMSATGIYDDMGVTSQTPGYMGTYGVARDITERKRAEETIAFQAFHDHLTHLPNQRLFNDRLEMAIAHSKRYERLVGIMFIDLDRFKRVNDTYGHAKGDELLKSVADRLRNCMRAVDTLARKGGDEFTVLLPDLLHVENAAIIAEKILSAFKKPFDIADQQIYITASIGISVTPHDGDSIDILLKHADIAMYKVKANGKNGYRFFSQDMNISGHKRIRLESELRQALDNSELKVYYQPQISVNESRIIGMEALIRWQHPERGLLIPCDFIDVAEEAGLISRITDWVLTEACQQLAHWRTLGLQNVRMSVNVSPQEFDNDDMVERICAQITRHQLPTDVLEIEITENIFLRESTSIISKMRVLRQKGVRISIDDFGTGYSSLNYLRLFPISTLKIDQAFVRDLVEGRKTAPIIQAIVDIARGFGLHLIAEGIETRYQMETLRSLGCDEMQGYLFNKPVPAAEAEYLLCNDIFFAEKECHHTFNNFTVALPEA